MPSNKTLVCPEPGCEATARRPLAPVPGCHGHRETPAQSARCPFGHGPMVEQRTAPKNRKPAVREDGRRRRW
jgi:hypothetical protein